MEAITGLIAAIVVGGTVYLAIRGISIPEPLTLLDGLIGGAFFSLRGAQVGASSSEHGAQTIRQQNGDNHG